MWARWRWLLAAVVLIFVLNNFAGVIAGAAGVLALASRVSGRFLRARRMVQEVRDVVAGSDTGREAEREGD